MAENNIFQVFQTKNNIDRTNWPSTVVLNDIILPIDVIIALNGEKVIAETKILDGVSVFERVSRKPFEISFDFNLRKVNALKQYIFPNDTAVELMTNVWAVDEVIQCENTFLNALGIKDLIVKSITFATIRGNTNIPCSLKCLEMYNSTIQLNSLTNDFTYSPTTP